MIIELFFLLKTMTPEGSCIYSYIDKRYYASTPEGHSRQVKGIKQLIRCKALPP